MREPLVRGETLARQGFSHGFSTRLGGVSEGCFRSLNLGRGVGDVPESVAVNHRRLAEAVGYDPDRLYEVSQVHGVGVVRVDAGASVEDVRLIEADALVTRAPGVALGVRTADCVPILLADRATGAVGAVHAGWRGVVAGVLGAAIDALEALGASASDLHVVIGPHIRVEAFEIGEEVARELEAAAPGVEVVRRGGRRPHGDLAAALRAQLRARGVSAIEDVGGCTHGDGTRFFSHRRDAGRTGRHLSVIAT